MIPEDKKRTIDWRGANMPVNRWNFWQLDLKFNYDDIICYHDDYGLITILYHLFILAPIDSKVMLKDIPSVQVFGTDYPALQRVL